MALKYVRDSLPWLVPSAAIAFAAYVFMENGYGPGEQQQATGTAVVAPQPAPTPVLVAPAAPVQAEEEIVARQASAAADLSSVAQQPVLAEPVVAAPAPVPAPVVAPEPQVQPQRTAALSNVPSTTQFFNSAGTNGSGAAQCVQDLKSMAAQARVYFPSGGLTADAGGVEQARLLGIIAQDCPGVRIQVNGHSDPSGDPAANLRLSERRAEEVIRRIGASGLDTALFVPRGIGDRQPSAVLGPRPRAYYDRRVEFEIIEETQRVALRSTVTASPWATASCVEDLRRAVESTVLFYAPRSVSLQPQDLDVATRLAELAVACPHARLRVIGQHESGVQAGEDITTGRLRAKALMAMLVGRGIASEQIIIAAPSRSRGTADGSAMPGSRVDFDVILEDG